MRKVDEVDAGEGARGSSPPWAPGMPCGTLTSPVLEMETDFMVLEMGAITR